MGRACKDLKTKSKMSIVTCKYWIHVLCIFLKIKSDLHRMLGKSSVKSHHEKVSE